MTHNTKNTHQKLCNKTCSLCGEKDPEKLIKDLFNDGVYFCQECVERYERHATMIRLGLEPPLEME